MTALTKPSRPVVPDVPSPRSQGESIATVLAMLSVAAVGLYFVRTLVGPAFLALTLVITVRPMVTWMVRHRVPRALAATVALTAIYAFVVAMFVAMGVAIAQLVDTLPDYSNKFEGLWKQALGLLAKMGVDQNTLMKQFSSMIDTQKVVSVAQELLGQISSAGSMLTLLALTIAFIIFDTSRIEGRTAALVELKPGLATALADFAVSVRSYWMVSTVFGLIVAAINWVSLWWLDVPMAMTWALVAFITNYIPNIGFVIGVIPPTILALVDSGPWTALWVVVTYAVANFVIQSIIQPKFTGDAVGLNMTTTFLSLVLWSTVIGALGTILAVPLTLFAKAVLIDSDPRAAWVRLFLSAGDSLDLEPDSEPAELASRDLDGDDVEGLDPAERKQVEGVAREAARTAAAAATGKALPPR
ncbi:Transport of quorum-sensing signal protein [Actinomyces bovis]|uniref:Transport of quorum-sensing signal protein n=1 Tax=Actinomyces bovis TaxID=1658 RepID=A0ABY1VS14_9ACTO|nr:AI-2E family transporter [Actinomyces bovis]SPT55014.1 Transport of quorum-sensing signal protein [Actinomyces bovis]VEG56148.1 Transport of quorum-sensing signal protein [Actinomyces israelii]